MLVVVPVLDPAAARECVATMAPELRAALHIVDQGQHPVQGIDAGEGIYRPRAHNRRFYPKRNIGIARCMNHALDTLDAIGGDLLVWVSTSMRFGPDGGMRLVDAAMKHELGVVGLPAKWHAAALRRRAFDLAGRWDENFYPAYYEDTDWRRRLVLASGRPDPLAILDLPGDARDGHGYDTLRAAQPGRLPIDFDALKAYYARKWGGCPPESEETLLLPWGDRPLTWWPEVTREQLIDRYGLGR